MWTKSGKCNEWLQWNKIILAAWKLKTKKVLVVVAGTRTLRFSYAAFSRQWGVANRYKTI
jgi:hypothetical protein